MKDYARIASKIVETPWLITQSGLDLVLSIMDARMSGAKLTDEEITVRLQEAGVHGENAVNGTIQQGVGVLPIYGPIFGKANMMTEMSGATSLEAFRKDFASMLADPSVKSIILDIDSPGGTSEMVKTTGDEIFAARGTKPVAAFANSTAGSAAYWLGSQAEKFYTSPDGMVGSVGAYTVHEDQSGKDAQQGRRFTYISAGKYKTEGNPHEPLTQEGAAYRQEMINELYDEFITNVARGRGVSEDKVRADFGGGRMMSATKGIINKMVDGEMEFDALVASMVDSQPQSMSVRIGEKSYAATFVGGEVLLDNEAIAEYLSNTDYEHSEPGTGSPPNPKLPESSDSAITTGSRRGDLPNGFPNQENEPGAPKANSTEGGIKMDEEQLNQLYKLFSVDSEDALITAVTKMHEETSSLRADVNLSAEERKLAAEFPLVWKNILEDRKINRENEATQFLTDNQMFKRLEGTELVPSKLGLSSLAGETVKDTYMKFAEGNGGLEDFAKCITTITGNGIVQYGEQGSSQEPDQPEFSTDTAQGVANARKLFSDKVQEVMAADSLTFEAALVEAGKKYPDLAAAYRATASVS